MTIYFIDHRAGITATAAITTTTSTLKITIWKTTWICELKSRNNSVKHNFCSSLNCICGLQAIICHCQHQYTNTIDINYKNCGNLAYDLINSIDKVLIERQSHLCHLKKNYCVLLLYYEPALYCALLLLLFKTFNTGNASNEKTFNSTTVLMPTINELLNKTKNSKNTKNNNYNYNNYNKSFQQFWLIKQFLEIPILSKSSRSRRRRRRRHLNSFCDNFKTI